MALVDNDGKADLRARLRLCGSIQVHVHGVQFFASTQLECCNKVNAMTQATDQAFYDRADAHIELANQQIEKIEDLGKVSASLTFGASRFNAWMSARSFKTSAELAAAREELLKYFCEQYRMMLEDNLDEHIEHFDRYVLGKGD